MKPDITHISQEPLSRMFIGLHDEKNPTAEKWFETGNFLLGVTFKARRLRQKDGMLRQRSKGLGFNCEGNAEPVENHTVDYFFYRDKLNGLHNVAFLCGANLWMFRLRNLGAGSWQDNRISLVCDPGYDGQMQKSFLEFSGWVQDAEMLEVSDVKVQGTRLTFTQINKILLSNVPQNLVIK
jgi:hypothetical protein